MNNKEIAALLSEIATFKELSGENVFKIKAFINAARTIETNPQNIAQLAESGSLTGIKGIGTAIAQIIEEFVTQGTSSELVKLKKEIPSGIPELLELHGMGPKKVIAVWKELGITSIGELEYACRENRLLSLPGFGEKSQLKILEAIEFQKKARDSYLYPEATSIAVDIIEILKKSKLFEETTLAGSLRRGKKYVKDADILLVPKKNSGIDTIRELLVSLADAHEGKEDIIGAGMTKVSIRVKGLQVDFRIIQKESYPAGLQYFTGSKDHNTILRGRAKGLGYKLNEYGIFKGNDPIPVKDEDALYEILGCSPIPAELRENDGEIEAAEKGEIPHLVESSDIKGLIHVHSIYSDGSNSIEDLVIACIEKGYQYLCLSDHSQSAKYAGGLDPQRILMQQEEITKLNLEYAPFRIFSGIESDIQTDGSLDYDNDVLLSFDFVIGSIHSKLTMRKEEATERLCTAISNPRITILGHISGRLLLSREGYDYDEDKVLDCLEKHSVVLEHNCNPYRLDPDWEMLKKASKRGILVSLDPDAHELRGFDDIRYGVLMARKGWLTKDNVLNVKTKEEIDDYFRKRKKRQSD